MDRTDKNSQHSSVVWPVWLSVRLQTKCLWIRITLLSLILIFLSKNSRWHWKSEFIFFSRTYDIDDEMHFTDVNMAEE